MLARQAGLLDWNRRSLPWAVLAVVFALVVGSMAQRSVEKDIQAADSAASAIAEPV